MRRWMESPNMKIFALILTLLLVTAFSIHPVDAQSEKLVLLMPTPSKYADPYVMRFKDWYNEQTGKTIEVERVKLGGVLCVAHIEGQGGIPQEDIIASIGYDEFDRLKAGDFLESYFSPNWEYIPEKVGNLVGKDSEGYFTGFSLAAYGIMVNTEVLENENLTIPTGYSDLALNKKYYGRVVMGSPDTTSIAHGNGELILANYGWVQGWNMSIRLASLIDRYFTSTGTATSLTATGAYAAVLTKNTYWNEYAETGYPVEWVWPNEGTAAYVLYAGILKGAKNLENAKLWMDWTLSEEGQMAWIELRHETILRSDIELPAGIPTIEELDLATKINPYYDSAVVKQQYDAVTQIWSEKLIGYHNTIQKNYLNTDTLDGYLDSWILLPMQQAEDALSQAQSTIAFTDEKTLTEEGEDLLYQAKTKRSEAENAFRVAFDHQMAVELANEASNLAQMAMGFIAPPPVWPFYLGIALAAIIAGSVSGKLGYDYYKKKYKESIGEIFKQLKDKLEVDEAGRLLLISDVMRVPMILTTRDHIIQIQKTCEKIFVREKMVVIMYESGLESGYDFSTAIASMSELKGVQILDEYLRIASVRGWGRFQLVKADVEGGEFVIQIQSSIAEEFQPGEGKVCHIWRGIFAGVVKSVLESLEKTGTLKSEEIKCLADGDSFCEIQVKVDYN